MTILRSTGRPAFGFAAALACLAFASLTSGASAQSVRFIATNGSNLNDCSLAAPCRTLQHGIDATPAGGELRVLNSGGYGTNGVITKSMTLSGNGNTLLLSGDPAILVFNTGAVVVLRELNLNGRSNVAFGIEVGAAAAVHILRCVVERFSSVGIRLEAPGAKIHIADSVLRDMPNSSALQANFGTPGSMPLTIDNSVFENNYFGILANNLDQVSISNSIVSGSSSFGIGISGSTAANITGTTAADNGDAGFIVQAGGELTLEFSVARGNGTAGLFVDDVSTARVSNSTFTNNAIGIDNLGPVETRGNNTVAGNGTPVTDPNPPNFVALPPT